MVEIRKDVIDKEVNSYFYHDISRANCEHVCEDVNDRIEDETGREMSVKEKGYCQLTCREVIDNTVKFMEEIKKALDSRTKTLLRYYKPI